jgi:hypothetical protein
MAARHGETNARDAAGAVAINRPVIDPVSALVAAIAFALAAVVFAPGTAHGAGLSKAELAQFSQRLSLTKAQVPHVNAVATQLMRANASIFAKYGIDGQSCSNLRPMQLSALNSEAQSAYQRARSQLSQVLSSAQLQQFSAIYAERRRAAKARIVCGPQQASR